MDRKPENVCEMKAVRSCKSVIITRIKLVISAEYEHMKNC